MQKREFWKKVEQRAVENQRIVVGGMPAKLAPAMEMVGLHYWVVGLGLSLGLAIWLWLGYYAELMRIVRVIIWR